MPFETFPVRGEHNNRNDKTLAEEISKVFEDIENRSGTYITSMTVAKHPDLTRDNKQNPETLFIVAKFPDTA